MHIADCPEQSKSNEPHVLIAASLPTNPVVIALTRRLGTELTYVIGMLVSIFTGYSHSPSRVVDGDTIEKWADWHGEKWALVEALCDHNVLHMGDDDCYELVDLSELKLGVRRG